jgi:hypothetical protein
MAQKYGAMANGAAPPIEDRKPCLVCDDPAPRFSWTDAHGEGYCLRCGTPYQLIIDRQRGHQQINIRGDSIPILRQFWREIGKPNGLGQFMAWNEYPDQLAGRKAFMAWDKARLAGSGVSPELGEGEG